MGKDTIGVGTPSALAGSLSKSLEGLSLELIQGEVFMVYPALGVYLIIPKMGEVTADLTLACALNGSIGRSGVRGSHVYDSGDQVLMARYRFMDNPLNIDGRSITALGYILSAAPPDFMATAQGYPGSNIHGNKLDLFTETMTDAFASTKKLEKTLRDISYGSPNDIFAGDMYEYGPLHTFLAVCASKTAIGASPMAMVEAFAFHDKVRITARAFEDRSTSVESGREPDENAVNYYERRAMSEKEGMGVIAAAAPFKENSDGTLEQTVPDQLGFFRHTGLAGKIADGEIEALIRPVEKEGIHKIEPPSDTPIGMVSERKTYDGRHETRAAGGIDHVKSLFVPIPEQIKQHDAEAFDSVPEAKQAYEREKAADIGGLFSPFSATEEANEIDWDEAENRKSIIRSRPGYWRSMTRGQMAQYYPDLDVENAPRKLELLDSEKSFYEEPPSMDLDDPVSGLARRVYALESLIRQQPDGTVVISDGHGSEIRMFRGRISISPAADLELRPGRDCVELVPRRKVINAGEELQLVSNGGKVRVKAETDVDILAANGGRGRILVESRGPELQDPANSGIHLKTAATLNMTGNNIYVGLNPPESSQTDGGLGGFARGPVGTISIDARSGEIGMFGMNMYAHMLEGLTMSSRGSVLGLQGNSATLIAGSGLLGVNQLQLSSIKGSANIPRGYFAAGGQDYDFIEAPNNPQLKVAGDILATGSVLINGTVAASTVSAKVGSFENGDDTNMYTISAYNPTIKVEAFDTEILSNASTSFFDRIPQWWDDAGLLKAHFQFDKPPEISTEEYEMQLMRWQSMLQASGSAVAWMQNPVRDIDGKETYAYPGHGPTSTEKGPINGGKLGKKTFNEYIVNVGL